MISGNLVVQDDVDLRDVAARVSRVAGPGHDVFDPVLKKENVFSSQPRLVHHRVRVPDSKSVP